jgi:hypothetical protein
MRHALAVVLAAIVLLEPVGTAHADTTGWTRYKEGSSTYVKWHTRFNPGQPQYWGARLKAIRRARRAHYLWILRYRRSHPTVRQAIYMIRRVFGWRSPTAIRIARCESGLRWWARNRYSGAAGLFQFIPSHWRGRWDPFNAWQNILHAWGLSRHGTNWSAWSCR